ncbi:MAG: J domain-containing protein [Magnetococcales bacterium]|nr:J domain-containing protein [Magnetococcales bacterium]
MSGEGEGLYDRLSRARRTLGLGESATLGEIEAAIREQLMQWHPDRGNAPPETCHARTREILWAQREIRAYCADYRLSFQREEVEKYLPPEEWWHKRFGQEPVWHGEGKLTAEWNKRHG